MPKSIVTILFSLALGLSIDHLNGAYQFSQVYGTVSGFAFFTLYCIASTVSSSLIYKVRLGQASDRFLAPCKMGTLDFQANLPMMIMFIAYTSQSIDSFLWVALSIAIGDIWYFNYSSHQAKEA